MGAIRIAARLFSLALVLVALPVVWSFAAVQSFRMPVTLAPSGDRLMVTSASATAIRAGVRVGDSVDERGMNRRERFLTEFPYYSSPQAYRVAHGNSERVVTLRPARQNAFADAPGIATLTVLVQGTITVLIAALVLWRRPGAAAFALGFYALGCIFSGPAIGLVTWLPEPFFSLAFVWIDVTVGAAPPLALVYFAMRFPEETVSDRSRRWVAVGTAALAAMLVVTIVHSAISQSLWDADSMWVSLVMPAAADVIALIIVLFKYCTAARYERRRIAWVLVGVVLSGIGYVISNLPAASLTPNLPQLGIAGALLQMALPLTLAYAILRHRVLDVGFALNRTLVYAILTGSVVVAVSAVDWFSGRFFESSKLSLALEGAVTIAFGVTLNWFHKRVERGIDRTLFRERHRAATRIEARIRALDFAESAETVDEALVNEVVEIMGLSSAAVFRINDAGDFARLAAVGWDHGISTLPREHVLLRTLRAEERTIVLSDHAIDTKTFGAGAARSDIAIPIGVRHQLLGCVLYGHRDSDTSLDPEECALLERLAHAGSVAYDAIEAAQWRKRAMAFETSLARSNG